jgi:glucosamine kinase
LKTILVGDIGSTKSSWYLSGPVIRHISLGGFNPLVQSKATGVSMVEALYRETGGILPDSIWYYGAGVVELQAADLVRTLIAKAFPSSHIYISTDLEGSARAACGKEPGTVAILGTGSHAAVFDGYHILRQANALGYLLGDEGGGCDIGKSLVQAYFYNQMPELVRIEMKKLIPGGRADFLRELYMSPTPNQYLAEMAKVAVGLHDHPWIKELISDRFSVFVKTHLVPLSPLGSIHILGSIGSIFGGLIEKELNLNGLKAGLFIQDPSFRLFEMHLEHDFNEK